MARGPQSVEIHSYQVGFGDCFLLTFVYSKSDRRHVLIDFGTMALPRYAGTASVHMPKVARHIAGVCGPRGLTAMVATHRHADHISGFGTDGRTGKSGEIIRALKPKVVLQPWTEDPDAPKNAKRATRGSSRTKKGFLASLNAMHDIAEMVAKVGATGAAWLGPTLARQLAFLGMDNIRNRSAVENLIAMGQAKGATAVWARFGSKSGLERRLPGVKVHVLGPPDLTQTEKIKKMRRRDPDQFWHLLGGAQGLRVWRRRNGGRPLGPIPAEGRWFRDRLERMSGQQLLEIVRSLDDQMNNTSLILLFEVGKKKLLFPGDAQIENWSYALQDAPNSKAVRKLLADVALYKVGHHGSLNATPKTLLWESFVNRNKPVAQRMKTVLSTMPGKHGSTNSRTEVPRRTLLDALEQETVLTSTHRLRASAPEPLFQTIVV